MAYINENDIYKIFENGKGQGIERIHVSVIDMLPRADVAPIAHGEWIEYGLKNPQCSRCTKFNYETSRYCPRCGARMDGERKVSE